MNEDEGTHDDPGTDETTGNDADRTLSQAEVDKLIAKTRNQATAARSKQVAEELGMPLTEAKALIEAAKASREAEMTEAQRAKAEADQARAEAQQALAQANQTRLRWETSEALRSGDLPLKPERLDLALRIVLPDVIASDDDDAIATAIEQLRAQSPEWFTAPSDTGDTSKARTPPPLTPGRKVGEGRQGGETAKERAARLLEAHQATRRAPMPRTS